MTATLISPSGAVLHHRARRATTPAEQAEAKAVHVWHRKQFRLEENRIFLKHRNVRAFLRALALTLADNNASVAAAETGSTPEVINPYRITPAVWQEKKAVMGLDDCSRETEDLVVVELLRELGIIGVLQSGDVWTALLEAGTYWPALPEAPGANGHFAPPASGYERYCAVYKRFGGTISELAGAIGFGRRLQGRG